MNIVIIGFGSIGNRHAKIIKKNFKFAKLFIVSRRKIHFKGAKRLKDLDDIKQVNPKYIIVATETSRHFSDLVYLEKNFKNLDILVEKPLFDKFKKIKIKKNKVYLGYNLRFHPKVLFLKDYVIKNKPIDVKFITNSYLPNWRKMNYKLSYSSKKNLGGGVLLDLSHELDLANWIFGEIKIKYCVVEKKSNLNVSAEDTCKLLGKVKKSNFFMDLSYYSKNEIRQIYVDTKKNSLLIDLKKNRLKINNKIKKNKVNSNPLENTYLDIHKSIIFKKKTNFLCSLSDGQKINKLIDKIKKYKR